jgi:hypothetical protein
MVIATRIRNLPSAVGLLVIVLAGFAAPVATAADAARKAAIEVVYPAPDKFTDLGNGYPGSDKARDALLGELTRHVETQAASRIPADAALRVVIADVGMAGAFEPLRGSRYERVRILRDVYPPRIKLEFRLVDAGGNVLKEGRRDLTDLDYLMYTEHRSDLLRHEKKLLDDWLAREFPSFQSR